MASELPSSLADDIYLILQGADLSTVSAKAVRKQLKVIHPQLDIKTYKPEIDALTSTAFTAIAADRLPTSGTISVKREAGAYNSPPPASSPAISLSKRKAEAETDEELAKRLHAELNGARPSRARATAKTSAARTKKKMVKSKVKVDDSDDEGGSSAKKKRAVSNTGFNKPFNLSQDLIDVIGEKQASRPRVTKLLWVYIKANKLQDPNDGRQILPDAKLSKVFPFRSISSFQIAKHIGKHLIPLEPGEEIQVKVDDFVDDDEDA